MADTAFPDCVLPDGCECLLRGYPKWEHVKCLVPAVNATAMRLGWEPPYDYFPLTNEDANAV
jgi:hypothetical protein